MTDIVDDEYYIFYSNKPGEKVMEIINIIERNDDILLTFELKDHL